MSDKIRVLLVDDEQLILNSLRRVLLRGPFDVALANSGPAALAYLEANTVDLIVSDYKMPRMTGIEFLREAAPRWPEIRRYMLTAQADKEVLDAALADGLLHGVFKKPWNSAELIEALSASGPTS